MEGARIKREHSDLSDDSSNANDRPPKKLKVLEKSNNQLREQYIQKTAKERVNQRIELIETKIQQNHLTLEETIAAKEKEPDKAKWYDEKIAEIQKDTHENLGNSIRLRRNEEYFIGALTVFIRESRSGVQSLTTEAYLDELCKHDEILPANCAKHNPNRALREEHRKVWEEECKKFYAVEDPNTESDAIWCCISHAWFPPQRMKTMDIIPHALGENNIAYSLGEHEARHGHLFDVRNGLIMNRELAEAIHKSQIIIVPAEATNNTGRIELQVEVIDKTILQETSPTHDAIPWAELQGRKLQFRNENQPGFQYLYYTMLMRLFLRKRLEAKTWRPDAVRFADGSLWGAPGEYWLRGIIMVAMARRIGFIADLEAFLGMELARTKLRPPY
ncbi:uncharacterized protein K452DRAFT_321347 [Aplosporella prunicola CBS 121167]|uniref:HNH nuclease domain-containing protein n=1 Tax=Aplosporella prunicola CBS 121167 TaxID=1176127 RepID=A0A6A6B429_9PEZI|nr:uncharacterized protein K452DRAFT_321347 [Aplosporella prunicola CBS 121167]KAF2137964.1 hypothetical protein K452DRAFT_321347 [Aplosporella prunicola CBS 121167]